MALQPAQDQTNATPAAKAPAPSWYFANPANPTQWASDIVGELGGPTSGAGYQSDLSFLMGWYPREGGNWGNTAAYNPLNTTLREPGSSSINSVGVEAYQNWAQGNAATEQTLASYPLIEQALRAGNATQADLSGGFASELLKWSGGGYSSVNPAAINAQQLQGGSGGSSQLNNALNNALGQQMLPNEIQTQGLQNQQGYSQQQYQNMIAQLEQQFGFQQGQFAITAKQLGISQEQLIQELAQSRAQEGFSKQQYGYTQKGFQEELQNLVAGYGLSQQQAHLGQQEQLQGMAASGVYNTGTRTQETQQYNISQAQAAQGFNYAKQQIALQEQKAATGQKASESQYAYSQGQIGNAMKQLDVQFEQLGLNKQEATAALNNALVNAGLQNVMTGDQLATQIAMMQAGMASPISSIIGSLMQASPIIGALVGGG